MNALDLFAGPGGWDVGARDLGIDPLGIEVDRSVCETRAKAGLRTIRGNVSLFDPLEVLRSHSQEAAEDGLDLLIASPPCQAWSQAGTRGAEHDLQEVFKLARRWGHDVAGGAPWNDARSPLAAEPMRWVDALEPGLIAFEQVPPVLDLWRVCASLLAERGYAVWTGILSAERYGVPQTRKRAILLASKLGGVHPPLPTHLAYAYDEPRPTEPVLTLEGELLPWVSMAEALGWGMTDRPYPVIASGRDSGGGPDKEKVGGSHARAAIYDEQAAGRWYDDRPATTIAGDVRVFAPGGHTAYDGRDNTRTKGRPEDAVRIEVEEAALLQTFPRDYPFQGTKTSKFQQIGNAYPPLMAKATLEALIV